MQNNNNNEIEYFVVNIPKYGQAKKDFFNWALGHNLYKIDNTSNFNSRMRAIYKGVLKTNDLTAAIAIAGGQPIAMVLSENMNKRYSLPEKNKELTSSTLNIVGFLSMFVRERYRRKGLAKKLMSIMEIARSPLFIEGIEENKYPMMAFEAREKAVNIIKGSKYSYALNCDYRMSIFNEALDVLSKHADAVVKNKTESMFYSNPLTIEKKEIINTHILKNNKLKKLSVNSLREKTPYKGMQEDNEKKIIKEVKKLPTLKPKNY